MKEFLDHLYKVVSSKQDAVHDLFDVIPDLANEKRFNDINQILVDVDLSKLDTGTMYSMVFLTSSYIRQLPYYTKFFQKVREEYARRGEPESRINELLDQWEDGGGPDRLYDPNRKPYESYTKKFEETLDKKIAWAQEIGDKELEDILTSHKAARISSHEREEKFRQLRIMLGDNVLRDKAVQALRDMANLLDRGSSSWPGIYWCSLPEKDFDKKLMSSITVIVSYPWGG